MKDLKKQKLNIEDVFKESMNRTNRLSVVVMQLN